MYRSIFPLHKGRDKAVKIDLPDSTTLFFKGLLRGDVDLRVNGFVIILRKPCGKGAVERFQGQNVTGPDFGFKSFLRCQEKSFDQSASGRITGLSEQQTNAKGLTTGCVSRCGSLLRLWARENR